ncbi:MAG: C25 family cysteine peptidase, partial [Lentisphaerota bacterium]
GYSEDEMPTDLYYGGLNSTWDENANGIYGEVNYSGALDEGDMAFDVIVARIPVRTSTQASDYIGKLRSYELRAAPAHFTGKLLICGDMLWNTYTGDSRPADLISDGFSEFRSHTPANDDEIWCRRMYRDGIRAYGATNTLAYFFDSLTSWDSSTPGSYAQSAANVVAKFNQGWNHIYFATHGSIYSWGLESGSFGSGSAYQLTNITTFIYTMACLTGGFDLAEPSLSEALLRHAPGGPLVYMGCSRYGWGSPGSTRGGTSMDYAYEFYRQVYFNKRSQAGRAFTEHKLARIAYCGNNGADRWVQLGMNLQGDPLVPLTAPETALGHDPFWFRAVAMTNSICLRWPRPFDCGLSNQTVHIRYRTDRYPTSLVDGTAFYTGDDQYAEHTGLSRDQPVYYTIWVSQDGENFITPP